MRYIIGRLLTLPPLALLVSLGVFGLLFLIPGDPAVTIAGEGASTEDIARVSTQLGLDRPLIVRYWDFVTSVLHGNLGESLFSSQSVAGMIGERLPVTLSITAVAVFFAIAISVPAGIIGAVNKGRWIDRMTTVLTSLGVAVPNFWLASILVYFLALKFPIFPAVGYVRLSDDPAGWLRSLILPGFALGAAVASEMTRQLRGSLSDVLQQDYIRTAKAKGLRRMAVLGKHGIKNSAGSVVTVSGFHVAGLLGGSVIVERVFGIPGLGDLAISSVLSRDVPMIQGVVLVSAVTVVLVNLLVDVAYGLMDPRARNL